MVLKIEKGNASSAGFRYSFSKNLSYGYEDLKFYVKIGNFIAGTYIQEIGVYNGIPTFNEIEFQS